MKNLLLTLLTILLMILIFPSISNAANEEVVWELKGVGNGIGDIIVTNTQNTFINTYNSSYPSIQIRNIENGLVLDTINMKNYFKSIDKISITKDDKYLAMSGDGPNLVIWDLENKREYKKISKVVFDGDSAHLWKSASISPDGTKVTAIGVIEFSATVSELVVFDLESGEAIFSESRNSYDKINQIQYSPIWQSTEFSPNGEYIVTELSVNWDNLDGHVVLDSVYVYNNSFVITGNLQNQFESNDIAFSSFENILSSQYGNMLTIYNLDTQESQELFLERSPYSVLFSRINSSKILLSLGTRAYIYNYINKNEIYKYNNNIYASVILKDDSKIIGHGINGLTCQNTFWTKTSVESNPSNNTFYPNPVTSLLNIKLNVKKGGEFEYDLFDINSIKIVTNNLNFLQSGLNEISINFSPFPPQTYYLKIYSPTESFNFKIVKE